MKKLTISKRTNWENKFYIQIKAEKGSMKIVKKLVEEIGDNYFEEITFRRFSNYDKWKDQYHPIITKDFGIDIVCGDKIIHMIFYKFPSLEKVNKILNKYCDWAKLK